MNRTAFIASLALFLAALFWGVSFVFQRTILNYMTPLPFIGLRFLIGGALLLPLALRRSGKGGSELADRGGGMRSAAGGGFTRATVIACLVSGVILFVGSAFQQYGIVWTTIAKAGFVTSLYVVIVPLLLLVAGRKILGGEMVGVGLALIGLYLMSITGTFSLEMGDALVLIGAFIWAGHVIYIGHLSSRTDGFSLAAGQAIACGVIALAVTFARGEFPSTEMLVASFPSLLASGILSVTLGFTLQIYGQKDASPAAAAIILQLEALFAALAGWFVLGEGMTGRMIAGAAIMTAGMLVSQLWPNLGSVPVGSGEKA